MTPKLIVHLLQTTMRLLKALDTIYQHYDMRGCYEFNDLAIALVDKQIHLFDHIESPTLKSKWERIDNA